MTVMDLISCVVLSAKVRRKSLERKQERREIATRTECVIATVRLSDGDDDFLSKQK